MDVKINEKKRKSNYELLRIVAMFLIVLFHGYTHINIKLSPNHTINPEYAHLSANQIICFIFGSWGSLGVGIFFLISAYFTYGHSRVDIKKLTKLILQTFFGVWF